MSHEAARRRARLFVAATLLVFVLGLPALAAAQSSYQVRFAKAENTVRMHEPTITWWEQQSKITLGIGLTIVALGIATGVLQALTRPWTRPATLIVGALITALTAVNTTFFDGDYKTLRGRANEGRSLIGQADTFIKLAPSLVADGDREEALRYIQESAESLAQLVGGGAKGLPVAQTPQSTWNVPSVFATVFAAGGGCGCDALRRQDTDAYRYFCGEGTARSLSDARKFATENALAQASGTLQRSQSQAGGDLTSYVRSVSSEVAACPVSGPKGFTMFVLLRLPSTLTTANAQQAFVRPIPASARMRIRLDKIRVIQDGSTATTGWVFEVRAGGKSFRLPNKNYSDRPSQNEFVPAAADAAVFDVDGGSPLRIEVLGRRSFGGDTATGAQAIATGSSTTVVAVRNATSSNKGSFEFTFSTERLDPLSR